MGAGSPYVDPVATVTGVRERVNALNEWVAAHPPPGPFRPGFWRSPIRGPRRETLISYDEMALADS